MTSHMLVVIAAMAMTGCAGGIINSPVVQAMGDHADRGDQCQGDHRWTSPERMAHLGRPAGYTVPNFCGAGRTRARIPSMIVTDTRGRTIARIRSN